MKPDQSHPDSELEAFFEEVRLFVASEIDERPERVKLSSDLEADLGVTGDDAEDLIQALAQRYRIDLTAMEFDKHFGPEGACLCLLFFLHADFGHYPVTFEHLARVAKAGRWFDPPRV